MSAGTGRFARVLSRHIDLDERERALLAGFEETERKAPAQAEIYREDDPCAHMYVVESGCLYSYSTLSDGRRQIVQIHHPGDVAGMTGLAFGTMPTTLRAASDARLSRFPKAHLETLFARAPRLGSLLFGLVLREQVALIERIRTFGKMSAQERLAFLLLDTLHRLRATDPRVTDTFALPLSQTEMGDATGLTNVTVSKALMSLQLDGIIDRHEGRTTLLDEARLVAMCDFRPPHAGIGTTGARR